MGAWSSQAVYPLAIRHQASTTQGGLLYSFGGRTSASVAVTNAYRYDPTANAWTAITSLPAARAGAGAVSDGTFIYIYGGHDTAGTAQTTLWRYDPTANTYTTIASSSPQASTFFGVVLLNNKIYRIGGSTGVGTQPTGTVQMLDLSTFVWTSKASYPLAIKGESVLTLGGYIYTAGGEFDRRAVCQDLPLRSCHRHLGRCQSLPTFRPQGEGPSPGW